MIYLRQFALLAALGVASARFYKNDVEYLREMWDGFKRDFGKSYHASEETYRYAVFLKNLQMIDERNDENIAAGGEAVHGITKFADLTTAEFAQQYLGSRPIPRGENSNVVEFPQLAEGERVTQDWTGIYTTPVKNQGQCGSCWAFSATEQIESDTMRTLGVTYTLSPQQITSCATTAYGCNGGWTEVAYAYVNQAGGLETEYNYPYTSPPTGTCNADSSKFAVTVTAATYLKTGSASEIESSMTNYVGSTGPLSVCLDASSWSSYTGGIMKACGKQVDHCVQAVGVDSSSSGYWKVRNSWGVTWGESGFIRLAYGKNTCNITNDPSYVAVTTV